MSDSGFITVPSTNPTLPDRLSTPVSSFIAAVMSLAEGFFEWFGSVGIFSWNVLKAAVTPPYEWRELIRQLDEVGSKSLPLVAMAGAAIGVVISMEARYSLS